MKYVIVRTINAGCFAGFLETPLGKEVILQNARRLWHWAGAASLSQLAVDGTSKPLDCKFPAPVTRVYLTGVIEVIDTTPAAQESIQGVPEWSA